MRVVTWNLWWRFGLWEERRKSILAVLSDVQTDVIGLQEVWACGGQNHAQWLASHLDMHMHWAWAPSGAPEQWQRRLGHSTVDIGNAVLSRWPIADHDVAQLPARQHDDDAPLALHARINAPTHQVPFFTTHLSSAVDASAIGCQQVEALVRFIASHSQRTDFPPIVTGDFNAFPDSDEVRQFGGYKTAPVLPARCFSMRGSTQIQHNRQPPGTQPTRMSRPDSNPASASTTSTQARLVLTVLVQSPLCAASVTSP